MKYQETISQLKEDRKTEIIKKATQLFMEKGIYEVSMGDVAKYCKVGVASLYRYFGTKNALVVLCGEDIWGEFISYFAKKSQEMNFDILQGKEQMYRSMQIFLDLYKDLNRELCFVHNFDNFVLKQELTAEDLMQYEARVEHFYQFFSKAYQNAVTDKSVLEIQYGEYQFLAVIHILFCMSQKFAQGELMSKDCDKRSRFELQVILDLYQKELNECVGG